MGDAALNATSGSDNTGIGYFSLNALGTGNDNVGIGENSLQNLQTGDNNVGIGTHASTLNTGDNNVLIGKNADVPSSTTSDYISINNVITGTASSLNIAGSPTTNNSIPRR